MGDPPLPHIVSFVGPAVGFPSRRSCDTLRLRPRSKRETGPMPAYEMRAERPIAVGGPSAVWRDEGIACGAGLGTGAGVRPRRRSLPHWGPRRLVRPPQRSQDPGSAALGQSLACQPLPFRWKIGDLPALRLATLAILGRVLVPSPAVATPALARVHLLGHNTPLSTGSATRLRLPRAPCSTQP